MKVSELETFNSVEAARDPLVQEELLNMAWEDGNIPAITHALSVIAKARGMAAIDFYDEALPENGNLSLSSLMGIMKALGIQATFNTTALDAG